MTDPFKFRCAIAHKTRISPANRSDLRFFGKGPPLFSMARANPPS
jgi:hypothetical protein